MPTVKEITAWLASLCEDTYPEDGLLVGDADMAVEGALLCWWANGAARRAALERGANLIVAHEAAFHESPNVDPGCPLAETWKVNRDARAFYRDHSVAFVRSHRTLDAYCVPRVFAEHLGFPEPVVDEGHEGYHFTLAYDLDPQPFAGLVETLKARMGLAAVRTSACDPGKVVTRVGLGWGGVSNSRNLQYMEALRRHGVEVVLGGEIDEYAVEYYRDSDMEWIELGHYASEILGMEQAAQDLSAAFPGLPVTCFQDTARIAFR